MKHTIFVRYLKDMGSLDALDCTVTARRVVTASKPDSAVARFA